MNFLEVLDLLDLPKFIGRDEDADTYKPFGNGILHFSNGVVVGEFESEWHVLKEKTIAGAVDNNELIAAVRIGYDGCVTIFNSQFLLALAVDNCIVEAIPCNDVHGAVGISILSTGMAQRKGCDEKQDGHP